MSDRTDNFQPDAVAESYARPLFQLAEQAGDLDGVLEQLDELIELLDEHPELEQIFEHQGIDAERRAATLERLFKDRADDLVLRFLLVLNEHHRLGHLRVIRTAYDRAVKASRNQVDVALYAARPLDEDQRNRLAERLSSAIGREAIVHEHTDEKLIGGLRIRYEDKLIDASVVSQLRRLSQQMNTQGHAVVRGALDRLLVAPSGNGEPAATHDDESGDGGEAHASPAADRS